MTQLLPAFVGAPELNKVYNVDALTLLKALPDASVDSVISDPPYGVNIATWDSQVPPQEILTECLRVSRGAVVWFGASPPRVVQPVMQYAPVPDRILVWNVTFTTLQTSANGIYYRWHPIYCWRLPNQKVIQFDVISLPTLSKRVWWKHPGTKPLELMKLLVSAFGGKSVLDPFAGSGTTLVAARDLGADYIGCDTSADYCAISNRRLSENYTPSYLPALESA